MNRLCLWSETTTCYNVYSHYVYSHYVYKDCHNMENKKMRMFKMNEKGEAVDFEVRDDVGADVNGNLTFYQLKVHIKSV